MKSSWIRSATHPCRARKSPGKYGTRDACKVPMTISVDTYLLIPVRFHGTREFAPASPRAKIHTSTGTRPSVQKAPRSREGPSRRKCRERFGAERSVLRDFIRESDIHRIKFTFASASRQVNHDEFCCFHRRSSSRLWTRCVLDVLREIPGEITVVRKR